MSIVKPQEQAQCCREGNGRVRVGAMVGARAVGNTMGATHGAREADWQLTLFGRVTVEPNVTGATQCATKCSYEKSSPQAQQDGELVDSTRHVAACVAACPYLYTGLHVEQSLPIKLESQLQVVFTGIGPVQMQDPWPLQVFSVPPGQSGWRSTSNNSKWSMGKARTAEQREKSRTPVFHVA